MTRVVAIQGESIRLGQLLKLSGLADDGAHAKAVIAAGGVSVNGVAELRRGRQLRAGDRVLAAGEELEVSAGGAPA